MKPAQRAAVERAAAALGGRARLDEAMAPHCTYRVGGAAALFVVAETPADLDVLARTVADTGLPTAVVGNGSNLLVADRGFAGIVIRLGDGFAAVEVDGTAVVAGGAARLPVVARRTVAEGLTGFEWAVGVPGTVGGAVRMNAGGHGSDMAAVLTGVRVFDLATGEDLVVASTDLALAYRHSALSSAQVVVDARLGLEPGDRDRGAETLAEIVRWRRDHQPGGANAGSVFTNPPGDSAGRLIDAAGAKGLRRGGAEVSHKHANFIQADPGATAADVLAVMAAVRVEVAAHAGVALVPETHLLGFTAEERASVGKAGEADR